MRVVVVGGGIVGLAAARAIMASDPAAEVLVLEKEIRVAMHQTGHNSGVVHAGLYYKPGSLKARLCRRGATLLRGYCNANDLAYEECGKVLVATGEHELPRLRESHERALANGVPGVSWLEPSELCAIEPHVSGVAGLHSPTSAIVDFRRVAEAMRAELAGRGATVQLSAVVASIRDGQPRAEVLLSSGAVIAADRVLVCAGLQADRLARASGRPADPRIIPFRGGYYALRPEREELVRGLIYPVPDPSLPFLGIHLTRRIGGGVLVGPSAVLALSRERYSRGAVSRTDLGEIVRWPGTRRLGRRYWRVGLAEIARTVSRTRFISEARRFVPELTADDVVPAEPGIRAQAVSHTGELVDDFVIDRSRHVVWVRNAPSPAATASLAIAEELVERLASLGA